VTGKEAMKAAAMVSELALISCQEAERKNKKKLVDGFWGLIMQQNQ
jgi:hypothetical protein